MPSYLSLLGFGEFQRVSKVTRGHERNQLKGNPEFVRDTNTLPPRVLRLKAERGMMGGGCKSVSDLLDDEHLTAFLWESSGFVYEGGS